MLFAVFGMSGRVRLSSFFIILVGLTVFYLKLHKIINIRLTPAVKSTIMENRVMNNSSNQHFFSQLNKAKRILIALPTNINSDIAGAGSAVALFLKRLEKDVEILAGENYEETFKFLPVTGMVRTTLASKASLAIVVDTSKKLLEEISYGQEEGKARVFLKSKGEIFQPEDITFEVEKAPYDLAIILGAQSLEDLGAVFEQNAEIFFETPKVNIDNHPGNKQFGGINLVDINSASVSEVVAELLQAWETDLVDENIATCLLSGIIAKTRSFQHPQVTPKSFLQASALVSKGARQQDIVRGLFKTRPLPLLKLWGRGLARLKDYGLAAATVLSAVDFEKSEAGINLLPEVLKELLEHLSEKAAVVVLAENGSGSRLLLAARAGFYADRFAAEFGQVEHKPLPAINSHEILQIDLPQLSAGEAEAKIEKFFSEQE